MSLSNDQWHVTIPPSWMQGRTTYGGLSAALCLQAVYNDFPTLDPLRSAQINFIGPAGGDVYVTTSILRKGKSVSYIKAEIMTDKGISTHAVFCFGANRQSKLEKHFIDFPSVPTPEGSENFFKYGAGPAFTNNFDCLHAAGDWPVSAADKAEFYLWVRHKDKMANSIAALMSIADMPPPAVLSMFKELAPISSMTWMLNFLSEQPETEDGWWLLNSKAEHTKNGYSSQDMKVWNRSGELVITGRQSVAIFY